MYPLPIIVTKVQRHEHLSHPSCSDMTPRHHVTQIFISLLLPTFRAHNVLSWTVGWDESILTCQKQIKILRISGSVSGHFDPMRVHDHSAQVNVEII